MFLLNNWENVVPISHFRFYPLLNQNWRMNSPSGRWFQCQNLGTGFCSLPCGWAGNNPKAWEVHGSSSGAQPGTLAILQTELPGEQQGNCPGSRQICIFLINQIHRNVDDTARLVLFSCLSLALTVAKWCAVNGHASNCLRQQVQHWEQEIIIPGPLLWKPVEVSGGSVNI